jgi:ribosomal protein S18 acetylase RimI-like enzyme
LLNAFVAEARSRGVRQIGVASYDFQAPGMYEKAGFKRMAEFEGWPEGQVNVVLCDAFDSPDGQNQSLPIALALFCRPKTRCA